MKSRKREADLVSVTSQQTVFVYCFGFLRADASFRTIPLPQPTRISVIDRAPVDCSERGGHRHSGRRGAERQERGAWTVPQGQRDVHAFVSSAEISEPLQLPRRTGGENWRPGRNRCSYRIYAHVRPLVLREAARFPFFG